MRDRGLHLRALLFAAADIAVGGLFYLYVSAAIGVLLTVVGVLLICGVLGDLSAKGGSLFERTR